MIYFQDRSGGKSKTTKHVKETQEKLAKFEIADDSTKEYEYEYILFSANYLPARKSVRKICQSTFVKGISWLFLTVTMLKVLKRQKRRGEEKEHSPQIRFSQIINDSACLWLYLPQNFNAT